MNEKNPNPTENNVEGEVPPGEIPYADQIERYAGGHITSRHGRIHWWLCIVYVVLFFWALYYGVTYWGGLGPGLDY